MRQVTWLVVVAVGLFGSRLAAADITVEKPKETTVTGYGEKPRSAEASALREAQEWLIKALRQDAGINWQVPRRLLEPAHLIEKGVLTQAGPTVADASADGAMRARYHVVLKDDYVAAVRKLAREEQLVREKDQRQEYVVDRHLLILRVLGGAVAMLLVVAGYLRLEEATRGYYTKLLRLGAFVLLALAAAGLWYTV